MHANCMVYAVRVIKFPCEKDFGECLNNINIYKMALMNPMPN